MATLLIRRNDANNDRTFGAGLRNYASGSEAAIQRMKCRLRVVLGEWFLDTTEGVPWWQVDTSTVRPIMGAPRDLRYAESVIKACILGTDGIASLVSFSSSFDTKTRKWSVSAKVITTDGDAASFANEVFG